MHRWQWWCWCTTFTSWRAPVTSLSLVSPLAFHADTSSSERQCVCLCVCVNHVCVWIIGACQVSSWLTHHTKCRERPGGSTKCVVEPRGSIRSSQESGECVLKPSGRAVSNLDVVRLVSCRRGSLREMSPLSKNVLMICCFSFL